MQPTLWYETPSRVLFYSTAAALTAAVLFLLQPFLGANSEPGVATYSRGVLHVAIPYQAAHRGAGRLILEVLDPEDRIIGSSEKTLEITESDGQWKQEVRLDRPLSLDEVVWHRLRYRFMYDDKQIPDVVGTESISQILRMPVLHIRGQQSYLSGSQASIRVIVTDSQNDLIPGRATLRIDLKGPEKERRNLYNGHLNQRGTTEANVQFPAGLVGNWELLYTVDTSIGSTEFTQTVRLQDKVGILLTTEKPVYQPGQIIHIRALALDRANHNAAANRPLTFEVEDSRGNKVFKRATNTDEFGIASTEFSLASEVNLGTYHLRALLGEPGSDSNNSAEIALNVEKYVLPKFKVDLNLTSKNNDKKHGYRPGDRVSGTVQANYFFGKPLDTAEVSLKAIGMDVTMFEAASVEGKTDHDGAYHFDFPIPAYLAGRPLNQGAARLLIEATVKDSAGHSESRGEPITVSESSFLITAIPEGGSLAPNLENQVFLVASYPDGSPVQATLSVHSSSSPDQHVQTDEGGIAVITLKASSGAETLQIKAKSKDGETVSASVPLQLRGGEDQVLLRAEHAVYRAGDPIHLKVLSTKPRGTVYIDVVKDAQTVLTRDVDLTDGATELTLTAAPEMAGTLDFNAYIFGRNAQPIADHRLVFVQPADELKIEAVADAPVYRPGDDARIRFRVTDCHGEGVHAALGLQIVDEAVFALAEKQPGFAKVFFFLEQEVMKPRYEIHSIGLPEVVEESSQKSMAEQRDRAGRALFAATELVSQNRFDTEVGRSIPQTKSADYRTRYQTQFQASSKKLAAKIRHAFATHPDETNLTQVFEKLAKSGSPDFRDAWGTPLRLEPVNWDPTKTQYLLRSAGPDKQFNNFDDMTTFIYFRRSPIVAEPSADKQGIDVKIDPGQGSLWGHAEISGVVLDQTGAAIAGAVVAVINTSTQHVLTILSDAAGKFELTALRKGDYRISVSCAGFNQAVQTFHLDSRDRGELMVRLKIGFASELVAVNGVSEVILSADSTANINGRAFSNAIPGGVAGGVMGGIVAGVADGAGAGQMAMQMLAPVPQPAMARAASKVVRLTVLKEEDQKDAGSDAEASPGVHVRSYFPEALYINPEIITDRNGDASISVPLADNITTWRMAMLASTQHGALGTSTSSLKVFQDFFVDLDLPVTLTQGDQVSLPVAIYNYTDAKGDVRLQLKADNWFALANDTGEKSVAVDAGQVGGSQFTLEAKRIGKYKLTLSARMNGSSERADVVVREIDVVPNGREQNLVFNGQLESSANHGLAFPPNSIPDASKIFVRIYPGPLSQIMEGMDAILQMPGGCFEQTSSSTYPNVLALDYMKRTKKLTPEVHAKAEGYIANGYQRLLTFEVQGGGFSWFGQAPANKILTAYGLMEFSDMSKVYEVDPRLIQRTQQWLASQQLEDGSWKPDTNFINEGATNRYNASVLRITAYIAWSLENTGYQGAAVERASKFIQSHLSEKLDPYTLAVLANFAVDYGKDRDFTREAMGMLLDARNEQGDQIWWTSEETGVYSTGTSAAVETTGLATQALLKWGQASPSVRKALAFLASKKSASGAWGNTQATIMALRALLLASEKGAADVNGDVEIALNGKAVTQLHLTPENNDLFHQFVYKDLDAKEANLVEVRFTGKGSLGYQVVGQYFVPWDEKAADEPLSISVQYDRTRLAQDDIATATATVRNNLNKNANMVMVDLGIPPGFDLLSEDLQEYLEKSAGQKSGRLQKFSQTATQAILYFDSFAPGEKITLRYRLRAKYPIRARTFSSRVYEYYDPDVHSVARPTQLEIAKR
jgi:uncharacterized protein YfaS (alpha-2-macroglobulin family)